jgi:hypothetical protein
MAIFHMSPDYEGLTPRVTRDGIRFYISTDDGAITVKFDAIPGLQRDLERIAQEIAEEREAAQRPSRTSRPA